MTTYVPILSPQLLENLSLSSGNEYTTMLSARAAAFSQSANTSFSVSSNPQLQIRAALLNLEGIRQLQLLLFRVCPDAIIEDDEMVFPMTPPFGIPGKDGMRAASTFLEALVRPVPLGIPCSLFVEYKSTDFR